MNMNQCNQLADNRLAAYKAAIDILHPESAAAQNVYTQHAELQQMRISLGADYPTLKEDELRQRIDFLWNESFKSERAAKALTKAEQLLNDFINYQLKAI